MHLGLPDYASGKIQSSRLWQNISKPFHINVGLRLKMLNYGDAVTKTIIILWPSELRKKRDEMSKCLTVA